MDLNQILAPVRPFLVFAGQVLIIAGLVKFFGFANVPINGSGLEIGLAGWLMKNI